ncbi:MAG TPA: ABC transporter ATP-binding protein [Polyangiaceae bacterium]|nr:ABC transporter ATP-binding protein [Polyangiaceae bacterium]
MAYLARLLGFVRPYRGLSLASLLLLSVLVCFDLAIPRLIQRIIDQGILANDRSVVVWTAVSMLGIAALSTFIAIGNNVYSVRVGEGVARDLREALFTKIQTYSFGNLDRQKTGQLMVRLTSDVSAIKSLVQISLRIGTRAPLLMLGSLALMVTTSRELALTMLPLLAVTSGLIVFFIMKMEPLFRTVQSKLDALNNVLQENIAGARLVKSLVRGDFEEERFGFANEEMTARSIQVMKFTSAMIPALTLCVNAGMVVVIWSGGLQAIRGRLSVGQIVAFSNYMLTTMTPLVMMTMLSNTWAAGLASARRVHEILGTVSDVEDAADAVALPATAEARIALEGVSFAYHGEGNDAVLQDIELRAEPGQTIAILGATGAGKSTLVNLVPRFYDVTSGRVSFADIDVRKLTQDCLVAQTGVVPQEAILFTGTVRDNIRYGRPDAAEAEVVHAAKMAEAHDFVARLPSGYDSHVEERGANFSGGQKQRLAIARALLLRPKLLLLDDSTSAVDVETETRIQDALEKDKASRTTIVVAQRISTVLKADRIYVLDKGRIVAAGTHHELMRASPVYQEIYESQLGRGVSLDAPARESGARR